MCCAASSTDCDMMNGTVFDIKEFTVHDGPGARVTVFLKGCPLRCQWCHNPEGLSAKPQILYRSTLCTHCGACRQPCTHEECRGLGRCVHACPNGCLSIAGEEISADALALRLRKYEKLLQTMGGGITFSGGEPLLQGEFLMELLPMLSGMHITLQTSGYTDPETYRKVVGCCDYVLQDIKLADKQAHLRHTGVSNEWILENIRWLKESGKQFVFRVPLIPGITDTEDNLRSIARITQDHPVELMPYNPLAGAKYPMVDMTYSLPEERSREEDFTRFFSNATLLG